MKPLLALLLAAQTRTITEEEVRQVHASALLIDTHNDVTSDTVKGLDIARRRSEGHTDLARLRAGGIGAVFFAAYVSMNFVKDNRSGHRALEMIDTIRHDIVEKHPNDFQLALSASDIVAAHQKGKIAALIGIEGGHAIEDSLRLLRQYYALGVRYMTLTHSGNNNWADSSGSKDHPHDGLTPFGKEVVAEMNRLGMMIDISHVSGKTFYDVIKVSKAPVFASHSSCRAISNIARNMTGEMIVALAKKGGTIQINFGSEFLNQESANTSKWSNPGFKGPMHRSTLEDVVSHIDHVVRIAGEDAVGIGSDFDGEIVAPAGLDDVSKFPALTRALLEKGYTAARIRKIYGGNLLRVMRAIEQAAHAQ